MATDATSTRRDGNCAHLHTAPSNFEKILVPVPDTAKRYYQVEALGEKALEESAVTAKRIWDGVVEVWGKQWVKQWAKRRRKEAN